MATLKNTTINDTGYLRLPKGTTAQRPGSPADGDMRYNTSTNATEYKTPLHGRDWAQMTIPYLTRTIISTMYTVGGYRNAITWRNVNRTNPQTDTTYDLGDQIGISFNYKAGFCSRTTQYTFGAGGGHSIDDDRTTAFNMISETSYSTPAGADMTVNRGQAGAVFQEHYYAWIAGGNNQKIEKFTAATDTMSDSGQNATNIPNNNREPWACSDETRGIWYVGENGGSEQTSFTFSTETQSTRTGLNPANWAQQKTLQTKLGFSFGGAQGTYRGGSNYRKTDFASDTTTNRSGFTKGDTNSGEENYTMGQDWGYTIGCYNGAGQTNVSWKAYYANETSVLGGASMQSKGVDGRSSATNGWRA